MWGRVWRKVMFKYIENREAEKHDSRKTGCTKEKAKNNLSIPHSCVNTDSWSHKNCDVTLLRGWNKRKYACMYWWEWDKKKVNPHVLGGNSIDNA